MDIWKKTGVKQQLMSNYKSSAGSSQFADGSPPSGFTCGLNRHHNERIHTQCKWLTNRAVSKQEAVLYISYGFTSAVMLICNTGV